MTRCSHGRCAVSRKQVQTGSRQRQESSSHAWVPRLVPPWVRPEELSFVPVPLTLEMFSKVSRARDRLGGSCNSFIRDAESSDGNLVQLLLSRACYSTITVAVVL